MNSLIHSIPCFPARISRDRVDFDGIVGGEGRICRVVANRVGCLVDGLLCTALPGPTRRARRTGRRSSIRPHHSLHRCGDHRWSISSGCGRLKNELL